MRSGMSAVGSCSGMRSDLETFGRLLGKRSLTDERTQEFFGPMLEIIRVNLGPHRAYARCFFLRAHLNRTLQALGDLVGIVRIHEQRLGKFLSRAGKLAQDQYAVVAQMRRDIFLEIGRASCRE